MSNKIALTGTRGFIDEERKAAAAITPGHLIELTSSDTYQKHANAAKNAAKIFALDQPHFNKGIDDAYAQNDRVRAYYALPGDQINCLVAAGAPAITEGDFGESAGDGTVRKVATDATVDQGEKAGAIVRFDETVDNSGGGAAVRVKATVI